MASSPKMTLDRWIELWQAAQAASPKSQPAKEEGKSQRPFGDLQLYSRDLEAETVLLVEDDDVIRGLVREILRAIGYTVLEARHGGEALLLSEQHKGPIHLMVSDMEMPLITGRDLAKRLAPLRPEMRVLYMSGSAADTLFRNGVLEVGSEFLQKPFRVEALEGKVRDLLDLPVGA
jgi:two-component system, cell cycle sensor histidine kinase and response regulator CckA